MHRTDHRVKPVVWLANRTKRGYIHEAFNAFHVRYYATENRDGKLVRLQKSHKLGRKDAKKYKSETCRAVKNLLRRGRGQCSQVIRSCA